MTVSRRRFMQLAAGAAASGAMSGIPSSAFGAQAKLVMQASWVNDAEFTGYFVAMQNGYYSQQGIAFDYLSGGPDVIPESALLSNKADVALTTVEDTLSAVTKQGAPLVVIGTQYQKSPAGIVSLAKKPVHKPADLVGKTLAVPPANRLAVEAMLKLNGIDKSKVRIVPYAYDPTPLLKGEIDASLDFVTNIPYTLKMQGQEAVSFLLYDYGFPVFNDTVVVTRDTLEKKRSQLVAYLRASRQGWQENLRDPGKYPPLFKDTRFKGNGRENANEVFFNQAQKPLIEAPGGILSMSEESIGKCVAALNAVGIKAKREHFDTTLLQELGA
jgi:ABC-type nitrate/sulfonate/bicarbonate transport system substrate-binding protein